jgi:ABC-type branched-subunit amino acid transport system substrate-binding protein
LNEVYYLINVIENSRCSNSPRWAERGERKNLRSQICPPRRRVAKAPGNRNTGWKFALTLPEMKQVTKTGPRAKQAGRDAWRVGVLFSRSGLMAITESEHFFGTALAIEEINKAGGILGREIEVIAYDPGSLPETYRKMADRLLTEDGVSVIFGC